jgi:hypothetical protein
MYKHANSAYGMIRLSECSSQSYLESAQAVCLLHQLRALPSLSGGWIRAAKISVC